MKRDTCYRASCFCDLSSFFTIVIYALLISVRSNFSDSLLDMSFWLHAALFTSDSFLCSELCAKVQLNVSEAIAYLLDEVEY